LPFFLCKATALPHQKEQKSLENCLLAGAAQFSRSEWARRQGESRREYFRIFKAFNEAWAFMRP